MWGIQSLRINGQGIIKFIIIVVIIATGMVTLIEQDKLNNFGNFILLCGVLIPYGWSGYKIYKARKTLWNKVKDLPEPIDLREIK